MNVVVLGGGVIGVTAAYYLACAGHDVTLIERRPGVALETSFANAGEVSPGYASPWAAPGIVSKAIRWMFMTHAPLVVRPRVDGEMIRWLAATLRNCTSSRYALNKDRMVRLAEYSRRQLAELRAATGIRYDERTQGTLQLFRTQKQFDAIGKDAEVLEQSGVPFEVLDRAGCLCAEPGLSHSKSSIVGGLRLPRDETGDCYKFTQALAELAIGVGVSMRFDEEVRTLTVGSGRVAEVLTVRGAIRADAVVVALGSCSPALLRPLGLRIPIYPVKGYSITVPIVREERAPLSTVMDETYKVAVTRLGDRIRVGGIAELAGFDLTLSHRRRATLEHSVSSLFPEAGDLSRASHWCGLRPMTSDGTPVVGRTALPNLYLSTGHGTLGWTMACGSGRVVADMISGKEPEIRTDDLGLDRYQADSLSSGDSMPPPATLPAASRGCSPISMQ